MEIAPSYVAANQVACSAEERGDQRRNLTIAQAHQTPILPGFLCAVKLDGRSPARSAALKRVALYGGDCVQESDCELALFQICT